MSFVIQDKDGFVFYDGPPPNSAPLRFKTEEEARTYLESGNWHLDGAFVRAARTEQTVMAARPHERGDT